MIRFIRHVVVRNWPLKLLAFFVALALWLMFVPETKVNAEKTLAVRLEVRNVPRDMELVERPTESVDITVRAPNLILNEITPSNVFVRLDLGRATIYQKDFPLGRGMVILPPGAEVVAITPNQVSLKLELAREVGSRSFPSSSARRRPGSASAASRSRPTRSSCAAPRARSGSGTG